MPDPPKSPPPLPTSHDVKVSDLSEVDTVPEAMLATLPRMRSRAPSIRDTIEALSVSHRIESIPPAGRYVFLRLGWAIWEATRFLVRSKYALPIGLALGGAGVAILHKITHFLGQ
jgi:hypothetical protein